MLTDKLKRALDALALAHAADYLTQRDKEALLAGLPQAPTTRPSQATASTTPVIPLRQLPQIALLVDAHPSQQLLDYALDSCRQFKTGLLLIDCAPLQAARLESQVRQIKAAQIPLTLTAFSAISNSELQHFIQQQSRLLFVIVSAATHQQLTASQQSWQCSPPLVVIAEQPPLALKNASVHA